MRRNEDVVVKTPKLGDKTAESLADLPFDLVAVNRGTPGFQSDAKSGMTELILHAENRALAELEDLGVIEEAPELPRMMEPTIVSKTSR